MSDHFHIELRFLGIASSPAFVREPEGNGCAERFICTLTENSSSGSSASTPSKPCARRSSPSSKTATTHRVAHRGWNVASSIVVAWIVTLPASALIAAVFYGLATLF